MLSLQSNGFMRILASFWGAALLCSAVNAQQALTIYNQDFAVVRDSLRLELKAGPNQLRYVGATTHLEPDSVVLRDPTGRRTLQILEQNFRNDPVSQSLLLSFYEGRTIEFENIVHEGTTTKKEIIKGKIVRSGYAQPYQGEARYGGAAEMSSQPIIEVDGRLRFSLPGQPLFPALGDDAILKPTLTWVLQADKPGRVDAEVSYITGGMSWEASYNVVAPENGETLDLIGWITMNNQSGKSFENARIKLLAGDVSKFRQVEVPGVGGESFRTNSRDADSSVSEKSFDEYHLYTLGRTTTLLDRETKQVEFVRASGIPSKPIYIYDGAHLPFRIADYENIRGNREYGTESNPKVWVMRELYNSTTNNLGMALPKGRMRFYRRDNDGQMEFTGENIIDHTPRNEMIRVFTGNAFDIVGSRKRTDYKIDTARNWIDESFEIKVRNRKQVPIEVRVVEHLYRGSNWELNRKSDAFQKTDAQTIEFRIPLQADEERTVSYTVHYTW